MTVAAIVQVQPAEVRTGSTTHNRLVVRIIRRSVRIHHREALHPTDRIPVMRQTVHPAARTVPISLHRGDHPAIIPVDLAVLRRNRIPLHRLNVQPEVIHHQDPTVPAGSRSLPVPAVRHPVFLLRDPVHPHGLTAVPHGPAVPLARIPVHPGRAVPHGPIAHPGPVVHRDLSVHHARVVRHDRIPVPAVDLLHEVIQRHEAAVRAVLPEVLPHGPPQERLHRGNHFVITDHQTVGGATRPFFYVISNQIIT